jgi:hypothetical protein
VSGFAKAKERLDRLSGVRDWRLHDCRRTAVTWMAGAGFAPHVADRLLNHVEGPIRCVAAVYRRGEFLADRRAALEAWAGHVLAYAGRAAEASTSAEPHAAGEAS